MSRLETGYNYSYNTQRNDNGNRKSSGMKKTTDRIKGQLVRTLGKNK